MPRRKPLIIFGRFTSAQEAICLAVMTYMSHPLSLWSVEHRLNQRGAGLAANGAVLVEPVQPEMADEIRSKRVDRSRGLIHWRWNLNAVSLKRSGEIGFGRSAKLVKAGAQF